MQEESRILDAKRRERRDGVYVTSKVPIDDLEPALRRSWSKETSADPDHWSEGNPAWGQCAVTALVVQDYWGGELLRVQASGPGFNWGHYFNRLPSGVVVDFTNQQFPLGTDFAQLAVRDRNAILDPKIDPRNEGTAKRYKILKEAVGDCSFLWVPG